MSVFFGGVGWGGRGKGIKKTFYSGRPRSVQGLTPYPFIYHFWQKRYPSCIPSIDKWYPFHIPSLELCIPFNCWKCAVFKIRINHKTGKFAQLFQSNKIHLKLLLGFFADCNDRSPYPFIYFDSWNPYPFMYLKPEKGAPFGRSLSAHGIIGRTPLPTPRGMRL